MTPEEKEDILWRIAMCLEEISAKLDRLISITEVSQKQQLESRVGEVIGKSDIRREIYALCDGKRTVRDIANILGKSMSHVSMGLSELEKARVVKARKVGKQKFYQKIV